MPQNEYMERWRKLHGRRLDHEERSRKKAAREGHKASEDAQKLTGLRAKLMQKKRHHEKIQMKKQIKAHEERNVKSSAPAEPSSTPLPQYLLDRSNPTNAKALSSAIKNKRAEKAAKFSVPLPKVRGIAEEEMFKVVKTGKKTAKKGWKRMITKPTFVGPDFTRRPVKYERFIRPMGLRYKKVYKTTERICEPLLTLNRQTLHIQNLVLPFNYLSSPSRRILKTQCIPNSVFSPRELSLR
jgi:ribosome biogenesis protein NSA2